MDQNDIFICEEPKCGRRFPDQKKLVEHVLRRHQQSLKNHKIINKMMENQHNLDLLQKSNATHQDIKLPSINIKQKASSSSNQNQNIQKQEKQQGFNPYKSSNQDLKQNKFPIKKPLKSEEEQIIYQQDDNKYQKKMNTSTQQSKQSRGFSPVSMKPPSREKGLNLARPKAISRPYNKKLELTKEQLQKQQEILQDKQQKQLQKIMNEKEQILQIQQALNQQIDDSSKEKLEKYSEKNNQFQDLDWKKKYLYLMKKSKDKNQDNDDQQNQKEIENQKKQNDQKIITKDNILSQSQEDNLENVLFLSFRDQNYHKFDNNLALEQLQNVTFLSLSHNNFSSVDQIIKLKNLAELNLNFNKISDIQKLSQLENLQKLYITNNNIKSLSGLENCKQLDTICAFNNKIADFNSLLFVLGDLNLLKNLDLEENPVLTESSYSAQQIVQVCQNIESLNGKKIQNHFKEQQQLNQSQMFKTNQSSMMNRTILFQNNGKPNQDKLSSVNNNSTFFNKTFLSGSFDFNENKEDLLQYIEELKEDKEELLQNYEDLIKDLKDAELNADKYEQFHKEQLEENIKLKVENEQLQNQIKLLEAQIYQNDKNNNITKDEKELRQEIMYLKQEIQNLQEENMDLKINGVLQGVDSDSDQDEEFQQQQIKNIQKRSQQIIKHNQAILGQNKEYNEINDSEIRKSQLNFYKNMTQNNNQIDNLNRDQNYVLNKQQLDQSFEDEQKNEAVNVDDDMDSDIMDIMNRNNQGLEELQKTLSDLKKGNIY